MDEQVQQSPDSGDALSNAIERQNLDQHSTGEAAERKAALPSHPQERASKHADLLDGIEAEKGLHDNHEVFEALKEKHAEAAQEKQQQAEKPALPESLSNANPDALAAAMEKFGLDEKDLEDPRWVNVLENELTENQSAQQAEQQGKEQEQQQPRNETERYQQHIAGLQRMAADPVINDPVMSQAFTNSLAECFDSSTPEAQQNIQNLSSVLTQGGLSLMGSAVPQIMKAHFSAMLEDALPGIGEAFQDAMLSNTWDEAREAIDRNLPKFGTPEFQHAVEKVNELAPWVNGIEFNKPDGRPLPMKAALRAKADLCARILNGQDPAKLAEAYDLGKQHATRQTRKFSAAQSLGAGRKIGELTPSSKSNPLRDGILRYMEGQKSGGRS